jgi:hypothetical protein
MAVCAGLSGRAWGFVILRTAAQKQKGQASRV